MNYRFSLSLLCLLALTLSACSENKAPGAMPPPLVSAITLKTENVPLTHVFVGQTEGSRAVEVRAQVSGILMKRAYEEGAYVQQGQLLFEIEPDTYKAALAQAEGALAQAQARFTQSKQDLDRVLPLYAKNAVSRSDRDSAQAAYDTAKAALDSARATVTEAKIKLGYAYVTSPVNGYASKEYRTVGNLISAVGNENLLTVVNQVDPIYANFSIPSPQFMRLRTLEAQGRLTMDNPRAYIDLADNSRYSEVGRVTFVDKAVNPGTSVVSSRAEFPNKNLFVLPGQFVRVTVTGTVLKDAILIPQRAIIQTQNGPMAIVVGEGDIAEMRAVVVSDNIGENYLVESGLKSGERIVVDGTNKAVPGKPLRLTPPAAPGNGAAQSGAPAAAKDAAEASKDAPAAPKDSARPGAEG